MYNGLSHYSYVSLKSINYLEIERNKHVTEITSDKVTEFVFPSFHFSASFLSKLQFKL